MRLVEKGAFVLLKREVRLDVLLRHEALAARGRLKGRPWWKPYNRRWTGSPHGWIYYLVGSALLAGVLVGGLTLLS